MGVADGAFQALGRELTRASMHEGRKCAVVERQGDRLVQRWEADGGGS